MQTATSVPAGNTATYVIPNTGHVVAKAEQVIAASVRRDVMEAAAEVVAEQVICK